MPSFVTAQVIIKEKVEINPQSVIIPDNPVQGHTVRVDIEWTPSNVEGSIIFYDLYCTTPNSAWSGTSSTGSLSFSHTKNGYEYYHIQFRFYPCTIFPYPQPHNIQGTYTIYYDGRFMRTAPFQIEGVCGSGGGNAIYNTAFRPPLVTDYQFKITTENFCYGSSGNIFVLGTANNCSNSFEIDTSVNKTLKLEILDGKEFASFYQNGEKKDTATIRYDNLDYWGYYIKDISIMADSIYTGSQPQNVIIQSNWADEIRLDTIIILHQTPTQIYVSDDQPIIVRFGTSGIQVKTYSSYGSDSCWAEMPDSVKYRAVITKGQNLGNLFDYNTGNAGDMLINLSHNNGQIVIGFVTEGENLTEVDTVIVSISTTDPNINTVQAMLLIQPNDINVTIIPSTISQGDTARVILKKNGQNGLEPFPLDKLFNVEIIEGAEYGWILDSLSNDTLTTFENILQGFKIIAKDSTGIDSTKIRIKVTTEDDGPLPVARMTKNNTKTNATEKAQTKTENNDDETILPYFGGIIPGPPLIEGIGDVVVGKLEIILIRDTPPPYKNDVFITEEPAMPEVICKAKLNQDYQGTIKYEWKFVVRQEYQRKGKVPPNCTRISKCEFQGLSYSTLSDGYTEWNVPFIKDSGYFWFEAVGYKTGDEWGDCSKTFDYWYDPNSEIFTGGDVKVSILAKNQNGDKIAEIENVGWGRILGHNPDIANARNYAGDNEISAIIQTESETNQFTYNSLTKNFPYGLGELYYPFYGDPNGFGIMQVDNPTATERELWNWKANINKGKSIYTTKKQWSIEYLNNLTSNIPDSIKKQSSFQMYNGGFLYDRYDAKKKKWQINTKIPKNREEVDYSSGKKVTTYYQYGIFTWRRYQEIINQ